jgi:molybdopterin-guanine dinucleotide biosynthesis protein A
MENVLGIVILAGGRSERMRRDKALIEIDGRRLIDIVADAAHKLTERVVIVGGVTGRTESIPDLYPGEGPLGGLIAGLEPLGAGVHLALACDMPFISPETLQKIEDSIGAFEAAVPESGGKLHPLCAAYLGESAWKLKASFDSGQRSLTRAVRRLNMRAIPESELRLWDPGLRFLTNINTPEEWRAAASG